MKLQKDFYLHNNVVALSKSLIGKVLCHSTQGQILRGIICETEAYRGESDKASHAYGGRKTQRTEVMYAEGGRTYIYLCYGIHHLLNVVSNEENIPHAILIRGIVPLEGLNQMLQNRKLNEVKKNAFIGPGKVAQALNLSIKDNNCSLLDDKVWIEDREILVNEDDIKTGNRVGVEYAQEDAHLPYRFQYFDF